MIYWETKSGIIYNLKIILTTISSLTIFAKFLSIYSSDGYCRPMRRTFPSDGVSHRTGASQKLSNNSIIMSLLIVGALGMVGCSETPSNKSTKPPTITIATAANAQFAIQEIALLFEKQFHIPVDLIIGSSGKLTTQIQQGAPFDILVSANMKYPQRLYEKGFAQKPPAVYANGKLVLWTTLLDLNSIGELAFLEKEAIRKIAIANPKNAPYGEEAIRVLKHYELYDKVQHKLVYGESIAQTTQFIATQNCEVGITAKSIVTSSQLANQGKWIDIPKEAYQPIQQGVVITNHGRNKHLSSVEQFFEYLFSKEAKEVLEKYGYDALLN